jgi:hypothetical protein
MKTLKHLAYCAITIFLCASCCSKVTKQELVIEEKKEAMIQVDVIGNSQFISFTPIDCEMEYVVENPPAITDSTILLCIPASFTATDLKTICGTYVVDSVIHNTDFKIEEDLDASFAYWNDSACFTKGKNMSSLDSVVKYNGVFFMQKHVLCNGEKGKIEFKNGPKLDSKYYRVLAKYNDKLCIIQSATPVVYQNFVDGLVKFGVKEAIYLDMGGWSYSWYRNRDGQPIELFQKGPSTKYQTNWLVFRK